MIFRVATNDDLTEMKQLFHETVESVCSNDYDAPQIKVWSASIQNTQRWQDVIDTQYVLLAIIDDRIVGFASLKDDNYLDFLYVHKNFQRQGIASQLLSKLEGKARSSKEKTITTDASITAKPFFEKLHFKVLKMQQNERDGLILINYKMQKDL